MLFSLSHRAVMLLVPEIEASVDQLPKPWDWYEKWAVNMYSEGIIQKCGGLKTVYFDLIPVGWSSYLRRRG